MMDGFVSVFALVGIATVGWVVYRGIANLCKELDKIEALDLRLNAITTRVRKLERAQEAGE